MNGSPQEENRSVPAGGPATINGVLYQLLWSLLRASRARIESVSTDVSGNFEEVFLTLEPAEGGDLVVTEGPRRIVEQLKARPDGGPWSLREVVEKVIPDLYRGCSDDESNSTFRFVTEGRLVRWESIYKLFQSLRWRTCLLDDPISGLDAVTELSFGGHKRAGDDKAFWNKDWYTEATMFERIVTEVRKRRTVRDFEDELTTKRKLWHLLGNFEFVGGQDALQLQKEIDSHLLAVVDHHETIPQIRDAMALDLARRATAGGAEIEVHSFFRDHDLDAVPLSDWSRLRANAAQQVDAFLTRHAYDADLDVRSSRAVAALDDWPKTTPILAVSGESGQGKSWRAYRIAIEARPLQQIVVTVDATGNADSTLVRAAETLWHEITGHDAVIPISQIAKRVHRVMGTRIQPWMLLVIDGVQDLDEAMGLVRQPWEDWGMRVLLTCLPQHSERIEQESLGRCVVVSVEDFDLDELHEYLSRCFGDDWSVIPDTIWSSLRRPLLANLYRQIAAGSAWRPESEYELYAAFWKRLIAEEPLDGPPLKRLVRALLDDESYPWSAQQLADAGVDPESLRRIERAGWINTLQEAAGPHFEIPHDRLLNWIVAATLVDWMREGRESVESLGDRLRKFRSHQGFVGSRYMGFVPMDFLWMAVQDNSLSEHVPAILATLEHHPGRTDVLYHNLVPTLGAAVVNALVHRLKDVTENGMLSRRIANAIGLIRGTAAIDAARELLMSDNPLLQRSAMRIFAQCPVSDVLGRLWELYIASQETPDQFLREHDSKHTLYEESYGALRECCRVSPEWLNGAIEQSQPENEPTHTLAYLVAAVGGEKGKTLWRQNKVILRQKVRDDKQRSLATCIQRFSDTEEIDWLADNVSNDKEMIGPMALSALAQLAPKVAIERLGTFAESKLSYTRKWYANQMFVREPDAMRSKILSLIQGSDNPWATAAIYRDFEHFLDSQTLNVLLDDLESRLEEALAIEEWGTREPLYFELELLASLGTTQQLDDFRRRVDSRLESMLTELLLRIGPRRGVFTDSLIRNSAIDVLYRIGGTGFTRVVNDFLQSESRSGRLDAIDLAGKNPDRETIRLLTEITESVETWEDHHIEQSLAAEQLADIGAWGPVLHQVERIGKEALSEIGELSSPVRRPSALLIQETRDRVRTSRGDSSPGAVLVLGMGGQEVDAELVRSILADSPSDRELADACVVALELLQDESDESVSLLSKQLAEHEFAATDALIVNGTQAALQSLREHARGRFDLFISIKLINDLDDNSELLLEVRDSLESELRQFSGSDFNTQLESLLRNTRSPADIAILLDSGLIRTHLREASFASEGPSRSTALKAAAIRCLARFDSQAAFLAAKTALRNVDWHDRDYYPYILMELDQSRAIPLLLEQLAVENDAPVVRAICGAMMVEGIDDALRECLNSTDGNKRKVGCIAAGWAGRSAQTETTLRELLGDPDENVSRESADALSRIRRRNECRALGAAIVNENDSKRRWLLLDCLLSMADPGDIHRTWPVEGPNIGEVLSPLQFNHATDRLKKLREKLNR